jgi:hypothetical protein
LVGAKKSVWEGGAKGVLRKGNIKSASKRGIARVPTFGDEPIRESLERGDAAFSPGLL